MAMVWASFAAPLKRFVIEFPFVAEKVIPSLPSKGNGLTNAVHQKYRSSIRSLVAIRSIYAVIACFSWWFPKVLDQ
jgi:hypothetical protein